MNNLEQARANIAAHEAAERQYSSAGGDPAGFDAWWQVERQRRITERIAQQQAAAREHYRKTF